MQRLDHANTLFEVKEILAKEILALKKSHSKGLKNSFYRIEIKLDRRNPLTWLQAQSIPQQVYWADREGQLEIGGVGIADKIVSAKQASLSPFFNRLRGRLSSQYPHLRYFGGICFDADNIDRDWKNFGIAQFILPQFEVVSTPSENIFACNIVIKGSPSPTFSRLLKNLKQLNWDLSDKQSLSLEAIQKRDDHPTREEWLRWVSQIVRTLHQKSVAFKKVVLARRTVLKFSKPVEATKVLTQLKIEAPQCFHFMIQMNSECAFLGASPERLYKRNNRFILSEAIAGTRPRSEDAQQDNLWETELLKSPKDIREHRLVHDMIHKGLRSVCVSLRADHGVSILKVQEGQHLMSRLEGILKGNIMDEQLIQTLHPTPAVGGYPTKDALKRIKTQEPFSRGWYAGAVGWVGFDSAEFAVAIRSALIKNKTISVYAGAGILEGSNAQDEWEEVENKMSTFKKIFHA